MGLAARGESAAAFDRRCILPGGVAHRSNTPGILSLRALPGGRLNGLGAARRSHRRLLPDHSLVAWTKISVPPRQTRKN
ncbi:MAG: hypothetical protein QGF21_12245, partial [Vicinamibacterales bacterium]|nr:hypothetical protein [Vicinamibacterales bacterium]